MRAVEALVQLCHDSLDIIAYSLSQLLETLAEVSKFIGWPDCVMFTFDTETRFARTTKHPGAPVAALRYESFIDGSGRT